MLVILKKFDILFEFAVEMRKIGTLLHYGGSGRWFEAILGWSLFFADKTCLCGSNLTQICEWRKWVVLVRLACFLKITRNLCFSRKKYGFEHDVWDWKLNMIISSSVYINILNSHVSTNMIQIKRLKAPENQALELA